MQAAGTTVEAASSSAVGGKDERRSAGEELRESATDAEDTPPGGIAVTERPDSKMADAVATGTEKSADEESGASGAAQKGKATKLQGRVRTGSECWSDKSRSTSHLPRRNPSVLNETKMAAVASCQDLILNRTDRNPCLPPIPVWTLLYVGKTYVKVAGAAKLVGTATAAARVTRKGSEPMPARTMASGAIATRTILPRGNPTERTRNELAQHHSDVHLSSGSWCLAFL